MELNADFSQRVVVHAARLPWGRLANRRGRQAHARSHRPRGGASDIVYAPASRFSAHTHGGGEEFLVLEGVFQDAHGDYPAGSYVRNPPTSRLWQFDLQGRTPVRRDARTLVYTYARGRPGV